MDVTPINLFGGIPNEDLHEHVTESTKSLLKMPQAMSTPITDVPRNVPIEAIMKDSIPLPTPMIPTTSQEEENPGVAQMLLMIYHQRLPSSILIEPMYKWLLLFPVWMRVRASLMMMNMRKLLKD